MRLYKSLNRFGSNSCLVRKALRDRVLSLQFCITHTHIYEHDVRKLESRNFIHRLVYFRLFLAFEVKKQSDSSIIAHTHTRLLPWFFPTSYYFFTFVSVSFFKAAFQQRVSFSFSSSLVLVSSGKVYCVLVNRVTVCYAKRGREREKEKVRDRRRWDVTALCLRSKKVCKRNEHWEHRHTYREKLSKRWTRPPAKLYIYIYTRIYELLLRVTKRKMKWNLILLDRKCSFETTKCAQHTTSNITITMTTSQ